MFPADGVGEIICPSTTFNLLGDHDAEAKVSWLEAYELDLEEAIPPI